MDKRLEVIDLSKPEQMETLKRTISEMADELDVLYSTTAPDGNISARQGRVCLYNNSGTYTLWVNTDGDTAWQEIGSHVKVGSFTRDMTAASGDVGYTGYGFTPIVVIFISLLSGGSLGVGADDTTTLGNGYTYGTTPTYGFSTTKSIMLREASDKYQQALVKSLDSDGFTLTWTKTGTTSAGTGNITCIAIG